MSLTFCPPACEWDQEFSTALVVIRLGDSVGREFSDNEFIAKRLVRLPPNSPDSVTREETKNTTEK